MYCQLIDSPSIYFYLVILIIIIHSYFLINKKGLWNTLKVFSVLGFVFPPITLIIYFYVIFKKEVEPLVSKNIENVIPFFIGLSISVFVMVFIGIRSCNREMEMDHISEKPFDVGNDNSGKIYWDFVHKQPRQNIIFQNENYSFGNYFYEIAILRNTPIEFNDRMNLADKEFISNLVLTKYGHKSESHIYAKYDMLNIPLKNGDIWRNDIYREGGTNYEELYWDSELKIMYYIYVNAR